MLDEVSNFWLYFESSAPPQTVMRPAFVTDIRTVSASGRVKTSVAALRMIPLKAFKESKKAFLCLLTEKERGENLIFKEQLPPIF